MPPQLTALIRTNINVQELTVAALMTENREHIYHAAMMDPHTAAELDLRPDLVPGRRADRRAWRVAAGLAAAKLSSAKKKGREVYPAAQV